MQKRIAVVVVTLAAVLVVGSIARTQSSDPWIGTWKVNLEKSTYSPGPKPTVAATVKIEPSGGGIKTTLDARVTRIQQDYEAYQAKVKHLLAEQLKATAARLER